MPLEGKKVKSLETIDLYKNKELCKKTIVETQLVFPTFASAN